MLHKLIILEFKYKQKKIAWTLNNILANLHCKLQI